MPTKKELRIVGLTLLSLALLVGLFVLGNAAYQWVQDGSIGEMRREQAQKSEERKQEREQEESEKESEKATEILLRVVFNEAGSEELWDSGGKSRVFSSDACRSARSSGFWTPDSSPVNFAEEPGTLYWWYQDEMYNHHEYGGRLTVDPVAYVPYEELLERWDFDYWRDKRPFPADGKTAWDIEMACRYEVASEIPWDHHELEQMVGEVADEMREKWLGID